MESVDSILKKGSVKIDKFDEIRLAKLKKMMVGEDTIEEEKQWLELRKDVAQQEGKHSHQYMDKMYWEISVEERTNGGKRKELVDQTEELIRLAHHAHYHQHDEYPKMLENLAALAEPQGSYGKEEERKKGVKALVKIGE